MDTNKWVVVADVDHSAAAKRTDSCGDMEQMEAMDLIVMSEHEDKQTAERDAAARGGRHDGWTYAVMSRLDYDGRMH